MSSQISLVIPVWWGYRIMLPTKQLLCSSSKFYPPSSLFSMVRPPIRETFMEKSWSWIFWRVSFYGNLDVVSAYSFISRAVCNWVLVFWSYYFFLLKIWISFLRLLFLYLLFFRRVARFSNMVDGALISLFVLNWKRYVFKVALFISKS